MQNDILKLSTINDDNCWIIHYACNGLYNSILPAPNIICIIISNISCENKRKFYIGDYLKEYSIKEAEIIILKKFADFIDKNNNKYFIHWNMDSLAYGFSAINARCKELDIKINDTLNENKIDLSKIVENIANKKVSLKQALMFNDIPFDDFLDGKEELQAYNNGNYDSILNSVHDKIIGISLLIEALNDRKFKTCLSSNSKSKYAKKEMKKNDERLKNSNNSIKNTEEQNKNELFVFNSGHLILSKLSSLFLKRKR